MQEEWRKIVQFPSYSVSDTGYVRNDENDRTMANLVNQRGIVHVGLTKNKIQYKRSLAVLVADAFVARPSEAFNTPINLDGDRYNNRVVNLMWRPRWFATEYFRQFFRQSQRTFNHPVQIIETEEVFENSWHAAVALGVLEDEIAVSIMSRNYVWPIHQHFRLLK